MFPRRLVRDITVCWHGNAVRIEMMGILRGAPGDRQLDVQDSAGPDGYDNVMGGGGVLWQMCSMRELCWVAGWCCECLP